MRRMWIAGIVIAAGCGTADPATGRLKAGQEATLFNDKGEPTVPVRGVGDFGVVGLAMGTRVVVVSDADPDRTPENPREVKVNIMQGEHEGKSGTVLRNWIRPVAK